MKVYSDPLLKISKNGIILVVTGILGRGDNPSYLTLDSIFLKDVSCLWPCWIVGSPDRTNNHQPKGGITKQDPFDCICLHKLSQMNDNLWLIWGLGFTSLNLTCSSLFFLLGGMGDRTVKSKKRCCQTNSYSSHLMMYQFICLLS